MNTTVRRAQPWLGTLVSIEVDASGARAARAFAGAFAAIARVHAAMSLQSADSDVARFNAARAGESMECDPWTVHVLRIAARLRAATCGLFDISLGTSRDRGSPYGTVGACHVIKHDDDARIDLGGIAKGYAVDRAVATMRGCGVRRGLVNAGGDLRAFGRGAWPVVVRGGNALALEHGAVATSQYRCGRTPYRDDALIAPAAGKACAIDRTVTVAAPRCVFADALTKVVALSGDVSHPLLHEVGGRAWLQ